MMKSWMPGIRHWRPVGRRHCRFPVSVVNVPNVVHAATIAPRYQTVLYIVVTFPRCCGCAISVIRRGQVALPIVAPRPIIKRPARYIGTGLLTGGKDCINAPRMTKTQPIAVPFRRPSPSAMYGANKRDARPPNPGIAPMMPSEEPMG